MSGVDRNPGNFGVSSYDELVRTIRELGPVCAEPVVAGFLVAPDVWTALLHDMLSAPAMPGITRLEIRECRWLEPGTAIPIDRDGVPIELARKVCRRGAWGDDGCLAHEGHYIGEDGRCIEGRASRLAGDAPREG